VVEDPEDQLDGDVARAEDEDGGGEEHA
jgi:hypothetical protein